MVQEKVNITDLSSDGNFYSSFIIYFNALHQCILSVNDLIARPLQDLLITDVDPFEISIAYKKFFKIAYYENKFAASDANYIMMNGGRSLYD